MSYLIPKSFWSFPTMQSLMDDSDWSFMSSNPSGLAVSEDETHVYVEAAVPGIDTKDVDITVEKGVVRINAAAQKEEQEGKKYWKRSQSEFSYQFTLPSETDLTKDPKAEVKNGVIHLTFDKSANAQPRKISVK